LRDFFCIQTERRKLAFVSEGWMQKKRPLRQQEADLLLVDDGPRRKGKTLVEG
jgi:hypothetical protein